RIRDATVTGVQTCALPILAPHRPRKRDYYARAGGQPRYPPEDWDARTPRRQNRPRRGVLGRVLLFRGRAAGGISRSRHRLLLVEIGRSSLRERVWTEVWWW